MLIIPVRDSDRMTAKIIIEANRYKNTFNNMPSPPSTKSTRNHIHKQDANPAGLSNYPLFYSIIDGTIETIVLFHRVPDKK